LNPFNNAVYCDPEHLTYFIPLYPTLLVKSIRDVDIKDGSLLLEYTLSIRIPSDNILKMDPAFRSVPEEIKEG
jgi:hypothetical protein